MSSPSGPDDEPRRAGTPHLRNLLVAYWTTALRDYEGAGAPFGESYRGLLLWFEFGQLVTSN